MKFYIFLILVIFTFSCERNSSKPNLSKAKAKPIKNTCPPLLQKDSLFLSFRIGMSKNQCDSILNFIKNNPNSSDLEIIDNRYYIKLMQLKFEVSFFYHDCYIYQIKLTNLEQGVSFDNFKLLNSLFSQKYYPVIAKKNTTKSIYKRVLDGNIPLTHESAKSEWVKNGKRIELTYWISNIYNQFKYGYEKQLYQSKDIHITYTDLNIESQIKQKIKDQDAKETRRKNEEYKKELEKI